MFELELGAERLESLQVKIDRPGPDLVAARERHARLTADGQQRAQYDDRGADRFAQLFRGVGPDVGAGVHPHLTVIIDSDSETDRAEQLGHDRDVGYARDGGRDV